MNSSSQPALNKEFLESNILSQKSIKDITYFRQKKALKEVPNLYKDMMSYENNSQNPLFEKNLALIEYNNKLKKEINQKKIIADPVHQVSININNPIIIADDSIIETNNNYKTITSSNNNNNSSIKESEKIQHHQSQNFQFRNSSERKDLLLLAQWVDEMVKGVFQDCEDKEVTQIFKSLDIIYTGCISEISRQISIDCIDRGSLLEKVWESYQLMIEDFINKLVLKVKEQERNSLKEISRIHDFYRDELKKSLDENIKMGDQVELYQNITKKTKMENRYLRKKQKKNERTLGLYLQQIFEQENDYQSLIKENTQLKLQIENINNTNQFTSLTELLSQNMIDMDNSVDNQQNNNNLNKLQQQQVELQDTANRRQSIPQKIQNIQLDLQKIRSEIEKQYSLLYEQQIRKLEQTYQQKQIFKKQEMELLLQIEMEDKQMDDQFYKESAQLELEFENIILQNQKVDTTDLIQQTDQNTDTYNLIQSKEMGVQSFIKNKAREVSVQAEFKTENKSTSVNLAVIKHENKFLDQHQIRIMTNIQKGMAKFIEKIPVIKFPYQQIQNMSLSVPILIDKEMENMKGRTKDIFYGLFTKEDMNEVDGNYVQGYFSNNYDEIRQFFNWFWEILQKLSQKSLDFQILKVESMLDLGKEKQLSFVNNRTFQNLLDKYKDLQNLVKNQKEQIQNLQQNQNNNFDIKNNSNVANKNNTKSSLKNNKIVSMFAASGLKKNKLLAKKGSNDDTPKSNKNANNNNRKLSNFESAFTNNLKTQKYEKIKLKSSQNIGEENDKKQQEKKRKSSIQVEDDLIQQKSPNSNKQNKTKESYITHRESTKIRIKNLKNQEKLNMNSSNITEELSTDRINEKGSQLKIKSQTKISSQSKIPPLSSRSHKSSSSKKIQERGSDQFTFKIKLPENNEEEQEKEQNLKKNNNLENFKKSEKDTSKRGSKKNLLEVENKKNSITNLSTSFNKSEDNQSQNEEEDDSLSEDLNFIKENFEKNQNSGIQKQQSIQALQRKQSISYNGLSIKKNVSINNNSNNNDSPSNMIISPKTNLLGSNSIQNSLYRKSFAILSSNNNSKHQLQKYDTQNMSNEDNYQQQQLMQSNNSISQQNTERVLRKRNSLMPQTLQRFMEGSKIQQQEEQQNNNNNNLEERNYLFQNITELNDPTKTDEYIESQIKLFENDKNKKDKKVSDNIVKEEEDSGSISSSENSDSPMSKDQTDKYGKIGDYIQEQQSDKENDENKNSQNENQEKNKSLSDLDQEEQIDPSQIQNEEFKKKQQIEEKNIRRKIKKEKTIKLIQDEQLKKQTTLNQLKLDRIKRVSLDFEEDQLNEYFQTNTIQNSQLIQSDEDDEEQQDDEDNLKILKEISHVKQIKNMWTKTRAYKSNLEHAFVATELLDKIIKEVQKQKKKIIKQEFKIPKILQIVSLFFVDVLRYLKANPDQKPPIMHLQIYDLIFNFYGFGGDRKYQKLVQACIFYGDETLQEKTVARITIISKFLQGIYDEMDFEFILNTIQDLDDSEQQDGIALMQKQDEQIPISLNHVQECIKKTFANNPVFKKKIEQLKLKKAEKKILSSKMRIKNKNYVDLDITLQEFMDLYLIIKQHVSEHYEDIFNSQCVAGNKYISENDFIKFYRYIESDDKKWLKKASNLFNLEADYAEKIENNSYNRLMSIQRFTLLCLDNNIISYEDQNQLLNISPLVLLKNLQKQWTEIKREIKLRLIFAEKYTIKEKEQIQRLDELFKYQYKEKKKQKKQKKSSLLKLQNNLTQGQQYKAEKSQVSIEDVNDDDEDDDDDKNDLDNSDNEISSENGENNNNDNKGQNLWKKSNLRELAFVYIFLQAESKRLVVKKNTEILISQELFTINQVFSKKIEGLDIRGRDLSKGGLIKRSSVKSQFQKQFGGIGNQSARKSHMNNSNSRQSKLYQENQLSSRNSHHSIPEIIQ